MGESNKEYMRWYLWYATGWIWLRIILYILNPTQLKDYLITFENEEGSDEIDNCK